MSEMFDDLKELKAMLENGDITPSEYDRLKADLLAEGGAAPSHPMEGKPAGWYYPSGNSTVDETYWDGTGWTDQTRPRPTPPAGVGQKSPMKVSKMVWIVVGIIVAVAFLGQIGDLGGGSTSGGNTSGGGSQSPRITTAAQGYQSRYGGETSVYNRILAMTNCNALQAEFDIADANSDLADPGTAAFKRGLGYMTAADDTMEKRGCYG